MPPQYGCALYALLSDSFTNLNDKQQPRAGVGGIIVIIIIFFEKKYRRRLGPRVDELLVHHPSQAQLR